MNMDAFTIKCFRQSRLLPRDSGCDLPGSLSLVWNRQDPASCGFSSGNRYRWPQLLAPGQRGLGASPWMGTEAWGRALPHPCPEGGCANLSSTQDQPRNLQDGNAGPLACMVPKTKVPTMEPEAKRGPPGGAPAAARPSLFTEPAVSAAKPSKCPPAVPPLASQFHVLLLLLLLPCVYVFFSRSCSESVTRFWGPWVWGHGPNQLSPECLVRRGPAGLRGAWEAPSSGNPAPQRSEPVSLSEQRTLR